MIKKIFLLIVTLFLSGCSQKTDVIYFSSFLFDSPPIIETDIVDGVYTYVFENKKNTMNNFLSIMEASIDPNADLTGRAYSNINILQQIYPAISIQSDKYTLIACKDHDIGGYMIAASFDTGKDKDPLYFAQYFFIHDMYGYVLTYTTASQTSIKQIQNYWNQLRCQ